MSIKTKLILTILIVLISGLVISWLLNPLLHELGHYSFGYAFNREAIAKFSYSPLNALRELVGFPGRYPHYVEYTGSIYEVFTPPQVFMVSMAGLFFQFLFLLLIAFGLHRLMNKCRSNGDMKNLMAFLLLLGMYIGCISILWTWMDDGRKAFHVLTENSAMISLGIIAIDIPLAVFYGYFLIKHITKNLPLMVKGTLIK